MDTSFRIGVKFFIALKEEVQARKGQFLVVVLEVKSLLWSFFNYFSEF